MNNILYDYLIHKGTMALDPIKLENDAMGTRVIEEDGELIVNLSTTEIMEDSCLRYGSSYKGRKDATQRLIHINRKPPIAVCTNNGYYFFPSTSPTHEACSWFSKSHIAYFQKVAYNQSEILFTNEKKYVFSISKNTLEVQLSRTTLLQSVLNRNFIEEEKNLTKNNLHLSKVSEEQMLY